MKNMRIFVPVLLGLVVCSLILGCGSVTSGGGGGGGGGALSVVYVSSTGSDETGDGTAAKPYEHIQKGLDMVAADGMVSVEIGIYTENITWPSKEGIILYSPGTSAFTLIDGSYAGRCIDIPWATSIKNAAIIGMQILNGKTASVPGAGIYMACPNTKLYLYDVYVRNCSFESTGAGYGAGINVAEDTSTLEAICCGINNNRAIFTGSGPAKPAAAGIYCYGELYLSSCEVSDNSAAGGAGGIHAIHGRIENCIIHHNDGGSGAGGAIYLAGDLPGVQIVNCTIASNETTAEGSAIYSHYGPDSVINCIVWGNVGVSEEVYYRPAIVSMMTGTVEYSDIEGGSSVGANNINVDPDFTAIDDFHLTDGTSNFINDGGTLEAAPSCDYYGNTRPASHPDPANCSMGAHEHHHVTL